MPLFTPEPFIHLHMHRLVPLLAFLLSGCAAGPSLFAGPGTDVAARPGFGAVRAGAARTRAANRILASIAIERVTGKVAAQRAAGAPR